MVRWTASGWLWAEACTAFERLETLRREAFRPAGSAPRPFWEPPVDVIEWGDRIIVLVAMPGVDPATVEVALEREVLSVTGHRSAPDEFRHGAIHRLEIPWGWFGRRVALPRPDLIPESCAAVEGCLRIVLVPAARARRPAGQLKEPRS
jgi:HSP20 family molecular chaperone IbpA